MFIRIRWLNGSIFSVISLMLMGSSCVSETPSKSNKKTFSSSSPSGKAMAEKKALFVSDNEVPSPEIGNSKVVVGKQHVCALKNGSLFCWGLNSRGQIGMGKEKAGPLPNDNQKFYIQTTPYLVFNDALTTDVGVGLEHTCALRNQKLYCWGSNEFGQVGKGVSQAFYPLPELLLPTENFQSLVVKGLMSCAISTSNKLYCWGSRPIHSSAAKDAGLIPKLVANTPTALAVSSLVRKVVLSDYHACYISMNGGLSCWGLNASGEIGNGDQSGADVNTPFESFSEKVTDVAVSEGRTCALVNEQLKCSGMSLGDREKDQKTETMGWNVREVSPYSSTFFSKIISKSTPKKLTSRGAIIGSDQKLYYGSYLHFDGKPKVIADGVIDVDYSEAEIVGCVMFKNRKVKCWGSNVFGQFGNGKDGSSDSENHQNWYQATDSQL